MRKKTSYPCLLEKNRDWTPTKIGVIFLMKKGGITSLII